MFGDIRVIHNSSDQFALFNPAGILDLLKQRRLDMTIKNGDLLAMPIKGNCVDASGAFCGEVIMSKGLTKREQFAMAAMQGLLVNMGRNGLDSVKQVSDIAVAAADALLTELERAK